MLKTKILEAWAILRILTFKRIVNALKTLYIYVYGLLSKKVIIHHQPMALSIEPTSICNLKCPECPTGTNNLKRPRGKMPLEKFKQIIDQLPEELMYLNLYVQGEPTMHPNFSEMVSLANQQKLYTSTSTNGHFITPQLAYKLVEAGLTRMIFSVDGTTQSTYEKYRNRGSLSKVKDGIKNLAEAKKKLKKNYPLIVVQFLVFEHNQHQIKDIKKLSKELFADKLELKTAQFNNYDNTPVKPPTLVKFSRYEDTHQLKLKGKLYNKCWRQWHSSVITWDGKMSPCCFDKDATHQFGNISTSNFSEIWKSNNSFKFKYEIFINKKSLEICKNCPESRKLLSL
nr:radical SAM/SPASM domain-containing protein [uncultured Carboxylicivirga sp.]